MISSLQRCVSAAPLSHLRPAFRRNVSHTAAGFKYVKKGGSNTKGFGSTSNQAKPQPRVPKPEQAQEFTAFTSEESWRQLDAKVNKYPMERTFTAVGEGGDEFRVAIVAAVREVLGAEAVEEQAIICRPSSNNKYLSVKVGPVMVQSADQVVAVYASIKADTRVKFCA